jgi:hypothetical protein
VPTDTATSTSTPEPTQTPVGGCIDVGVTPVPSPDPDDLVYYPSCINPICLSTPPPLAVTSQVVCETPNLATELAQPGFVAVSFAPMPGGPLTPVDGSSIQYNATFVPHAAGAYGIALSFAGGEYVRCMHQMYGTDATNDDIPDGYFGYVRIGRGFDSGGGNISDQHMVSRFVGQLFLETPRSVSFTVGRVPGGYVIACTIDGVTATGFAPVISATVALPAVFVTNTVLHDFNLDVFKDYAVQRADGMFAGMAVSTLAALPEIVLIDPSGYVYEAPDTSIRIPGAAVFLERFDGTNFVLTDPVDDAALYSPLDNPELTLSNGGYRWDVAAGTYRVRVVKTGCDPATSGPVVVPPEVTDLNVGLVCHDDDADGVADWRETNSGVFTSLLATGTSPFDPNTDADGCSDGAELGAVPNAGGDRNPTYFWDFFDVTFDDAIDLQDVLAILDRFGALPGGDRYHIFFDRYAPAETKPWRTAPAVGEHLGIDLQDALLNLQSFGHRCVAGS